MVGSGHFCRRPDFYGAVRWRLLTSGEFGDRTTDETAMWSGSVRSAAGDTQTLPATLANRNPQSLAGASTRPLIPFRAEADGIAGLTLTIAPVLSPQTAGNSGDISVYYG